MRPLRLAQSRQAGTAAGGGGRAGEALYARGALYAPLILKGQDFYRLLSAVFLHADAAHLVNNMIVQFAAGTILERRAGHAGYAAVYLLSGIAGKTPFTVITVYKNMMNKEVGFVRRTLAVLEDLGISFDHIPTGIDSLSVVIESSELEDKLDEVLTEFEQRLHPDEISVVSDIAMIAVVGAGLSKTIGAAAKITSALRDAGINIRMLNQGISEINVILGVDSPDFEPAIRAIYDAFTK